MDKNIQEEVAPIVIDLGALANSEINELTTLQKLGMMAPEFLGSWIQSIMGAMFGGPSIPVTVRGTSSQIKTFANTLQKEKRYIENYNKYGLNNPNTYKSKAKLQDAVSKFERATNIKWPFK
jgi:hypothetical protein